MVTDWYQRQYVNYIKIYDTGIEPPLPIPDAPRNLIGFGDTVSQISLSWRFPLNVLATEYKIYKKIGGTYVHFDTVEHSGDIETLQYWTDSDLSPGITYYYRVSAVNAQGVEGPYSSWSGTVGNWI